MQTMTTYNSTSDDANTFLEGATTYLIFRYLKDAPIHYVMRDLTLRDLHVLSHSLSRELPDVVVMGARFETNDDDARDITWFTERRDIERLKYIFDGMRRFTMGGEPSENMLLGAELLPDETSADFEQLHTLLTFLAHVHEHPLVLTGNAHTFLIDYRDSDGLYSTRLHTRLQSSAVRVLQYDYADGVVTRETGLLRRTHDIKRTIARQSIENATTP